MEKNAFVPFSVVVRGRMVEFHKPVVMGILNITTDSFYDGGRHNDPEAMLSHARRLLDDGADIIDVGASSSRPGATLLPQEQEAQRLREAISLLRSELPQAIISVDTCFAAPARVAIEAGADIINDIGGGDTDPLMFSTVAELQVPYVLMHGAQAHFERRVESIDDMVKFLSSRLDALYRLGVKDVWVDPGFGFGKGLEGDHEMLRRLDEITSLFREPVLVGLSRKSMIYKPLGLTPDDALEGTVALNALALDRGARILRVHDPVPACQTIRLLNI